jgi:DNA-binding transcriptional LysR family regulator
LELKHVKLFCLILEQGGVSKAAKVAGLGQPTVSQHLKSLEEDLGIALFERRGRRVIPTESARILYPFAKQALQILESGRRALEEHVGLLRGRLLIAGSTIPGHYILPFLMAKFHQLFPQVEMRLEVGDTQWVVERVRSSQVEVGFVGARLDTPGMVFEPFAKDELAIIAANSHPMANHTIPLEKLEALNLVAREPGSGTRTSFEARLKERGFDPSRLKIVAELGSTEAVIRAVKTGMGAAVVSMWAVAEELQRGTLKRIFLEGPPVEREFYLVRTTTFPLSPAARKFAELVMEEKEALDWKW